MQKRSPPQIQVGAPAPLHSQKRRACGSAQQPSRVVLAKEAKAQEVLGAGRDLPGEQSRRSIDKSKLEEVPATGGVGWKHL